MRHMFTFACFLFIGAVASAEVSLTVYSAADPAEFDPQQFIAEQQRMYSGINGYNVPGFGVVKDVRPIQFTKGRNTLKFTDVAQYIDPTTVSFVDLEQPEATAVLEQQFLFDLVSPDKLLDKYIDKTITVTVPDGTETTTVTGKLLSNQNNAVLETKDGLVIVGMRYRTELPSLPEGLITKPTLQWLVESEAAGRRKVRTTYQTAGLTWRADYNLVLNDAQTQADLGAWVTLMNLSGASYDDARLKLIAGDVQRVRGSGAYDRNTFSDVQLSASAQGFEEKSFYEYHLYTLPRRTDVAQNSTQQITLFPTVSRVKVEKVLVYDGAPQPPRRYRTDEPVTDRAFGEAGDKKVDVYVRIDNTEANKLGMPLPRGKVRVYMEDEADGALEFIGEDVIDHTAKNEQVLVKTGQSFDVTGQRTQTDFKVDVGERVMVESFRITVSNAKDVPQNVLISETLYRWFTWEITDHTDEFKKLDSRRIQFAVEVPAGGEKTVEYTVKYTW